ncbi:hypothetical protein Q4F19_01825 [Sphingomonas sp. BIUV-7]|uniref:Uncharacterized protein n=1 Tax=Sphingomonas natans TaxID=3063330 RepID=A0ABT8Y468_9SPHN|nr:hypothetical protein [Sphingomonas sp. BIUV-7]MDO6413109.1 hypothetical protein [Sphingomonas sp. BIUV-7]
MKRLALALAALALPASASAQALRCIPQDQAAALVTFALPSLVGGLAQRCGPELPRASYLMANSTALADRYRPDAAAAWPTARAAIAGIFTQFLGQEMPAEMNGDLVRQLAEPLLGSLLAKRISTTDCLAVDSAISAAAALPGRNVGRLAVVAITLADKKDKGIAGVLHICRPEMRP